VTQKRFNSRSNGCHQEDYYVSVVGLLKKSAIVILLASVSVAGLAACAGKN
jgi:hypothetical protein